MIKLLINTLFHVEVLAPKMLTAIFEIFSDKESSTTTNLVHFFVIQIPSLLRYK